MAFLKSQKEDSILFSAKVEISILGNQEGIVQYQYSTPTGNNPEKFSNKTYLWQTNGPFVPYSDTDFKVEGVPGVSNAGKPTLEDTIGDEQYLLAYAVGNSVNNICAFTTIPASGDENPGTTFSSQLSILNKPTTESVIIKYQTPIGNKPKTNNNVCRIFNTQIAPYQKDSSLIQEGTFVNDTASGQVRFDFSTPLQRDNPYTVAYYMDNSDQGWSTLACSITFMIPSGS